MTRHAMEHSPIEALRALHEHLWDDERAMARFAPGAVANADVRPLGLHSVRETALGAFLDLGDGNSERAVAALRNVLALQYPLSKRPWSGTFPVAAEQPEPPGDDAVEWMHYDPNWRQFLGCILMLCALEFGEVLPADVTHSIAEALRGCVGGEPDERIPRWYTNPNLMHAWLQGHLATATDDLELRAAAHARIAVQMERLLRYGDIDEYNSPTYDGIDLLALGLWVAHPPTDAFRDAAATMLPRIGERISTLYHPRFGTTCGPYIRAYGLDPRRYVSLSGVLFSTLGEPHDLVLPSPIRPDTEHVHDLYFLPLLRCLAPSLRPHVRFAAAVGERTHLQRFRQAVAESLLRPDLAVGWDRGRRHEASLDQYVPFSAHVAQPDGSTAVIGIAVPAETAWIDCHRAADLEFTITATGRQGSVGVRIVGATAADLDGDIVTVGPAVVRFGSPPTEIAGASSPNADELHLGWPQDEITARVSISTVSGSVPDLTDG